MTAATIAFANHQACADEPTASPNTTHAGLEDSWVYFDQSGNTVFVGDDANNGNIANAGSAKVCYQTYFNGSPLSGGGVTATSIATGTPGKMFTLAGYGDITPVALGQTGAEVGGVNPVPDEPGGGTVGANTIVTGTCVKANGLNQLPTCGNTGNVLVSGAEGDLPQRTEPTCFVDVNPPSACDVYHQQIKVGGAAGQTITVTRTGLPAGNGTTTHNVTQMCVRTTGTGLSVTVTTTCI